MTLSVYTARISYAGPDRLDVTRKSGGLIGSVFAPSWALLRPYLAKRRAGTLTGADWTEYRERYLDEMAWSRRDHEATWLGVLCRDVVTLVCYCTDAKHCHRRLLAEQFAAMGAVDCGERADD